MKWSLILLIIQEAPWVRDRIFSLLLVTLVFESHFPFFFWHCCSLVYEYLVNSLCILGALMASLLDLLECRCTVKVLVSQSCLTFCDFIDCRLPVFFVHGILQSRILEWIACPFSRGSSWPRDRTCVSHITGRFFTIWAIYTDAIHKSLHGVISFWRESLRTTFKYLLSASFLKFSHLEKVHIYIKMSIC